MGEYLDIARQVPRAALGERMVPGEQDPRPDLVEDHLLWERVLAVAHEQNTDLWGVLHGLRCCGAKLGRTGGRLMLRPRVDPTGSQALWPDEQAWARDRQTWLLPRAAAVQAVLEAVDQGALPCEAPSVPRKAQYSPL